MNPRITTQNYEEYLLLSMDGELTATEQQAFDTFLTAHPELSSLMAEYAGTIVPLPEPAVVFDAKETLLKPEVPVRKTISYKPIWWAAAAVLLLSVGIYFASQPPASVPVVATTTPVPVSSQPAPVPETQVPTSVPTGAVAKTPSPSVLAVRPIERQSIESRANQPESNQAIPADLQPLPVFATTLPEATMVFPETAQPVAVILPKTPQPLSSGRLTIELPLLDQLRETAAEKVAQVRTVRQSIKNTEATVAVAGYELFTIRL